MKRSDDDIDRLLHDWHRVAATATPPADPATRPAVRGGSAALPASLGVVVIAVIALAVLVGRPGVGPVGGDASPSAGPSASGVAGDGPVTSTVEEGGLRLTLTADRGVYREGDEIAAAATVEYLGPDATREVSHAHSAAVFGVREVDGNRSVSGGSRPSLETTTFERGVAVAYPWVKSGGTTGDPQADAFFAEYMAGDALRLPAGTWDLSVVFGSALTTSVRVTVLPSPSTAEASPASPAVAVMRDERFELRLTIARDRYTEGDDILAEASVTYLGPDGTTTVSHGGSPVLFTVKEVGGSREILGGMDTPCLRSEWPRDVPQVFPWERSGGYSTTDMTEADRFAKAYLEDGPAGGLRLPAGTWRLGVTLLVTPGAECASAEPMTVDLTIPVDPATAAATAAPVPDPSGTPAQTPALSPRAGPIVRCDGLDTDVCEGAIAVARAHAPAAYAAAELVVAANVCRPGQRCRFGFSAIILFVPRDGDARRSPAFTVSGTRGPETAAPGGAIPAWLEAIVEDWDVIGDGVLVPIPLGEPRLPGAATACGGPVVRGVLVEHPTLGLALELDDGTTRPVQWPFGYVGYRDTEGHALLDLDGARVAGVGEALELRAAEPRAGDQRSLIGCGRVTRVQPASAMALDPVVRCIRVDAEDCEGSVALARKLWPDAYAAAELVLVADGCGPDPDCDGFAAIVAFLPRAGEAMGQTVIVHGTGGPEVADPTQTPAMLTDELDQLAQQGFDEGDGATLFQVRTDAPRAPGETHACPMAAISGTLAENAATGIGLIASGQSVGVTWPFGFAGRRDATRVSVVDVNGVVVGRVGEPFAGGGQGIGGDPPLVRVCSY